MSTKVRLCEGCENPLGPMDGGYDVCMACTIARQKAVMKRFRCVCAKTKKRPTEPVEVGGYNVRLPGGEVVKRGARIVITCKRCLGSIDPPKES